MGASIFDRREIIFTIKHALRFMPPYKNKPRGEYFYTLRGLIPPPVIHQTPCSVRIISKLWQYIPHHTKHVGTEVTIKDESTMTITIEAVALTTVDNKYDPIEDFDNWYARDNELGYGTACYLAREVVLTDDMTLVEQEKEKERAIDKIVLADPINLYRKVKRKVDVDIGDD